MPKARNIPNEAKVAPAKTSKTGRVTKSTETVAALNQRITVLEKKMKATQRSVKVLEQRADDLMTTLEQWVDVIHRWGSRIDGKIRELDEGCQNLSVAIGANIVDSYKVQTLRSSLAVLVDQGGATPVDGDAARIFRSLRD